MASPETPEILFKVIEGKYSELESQKIWLEFNDWLTRNVPENKLLEMMDMFEHLYTVVRGEHMAVIHESLAVLENALSRDSKIKSKVEVVTDWKK